MVAMNKKPDQESLGRNPFVSTLRMGDGPDKLLHKQIHNKEFVREWIKQSPAWLEPGRRLDAIIAIHVLGWRHGEDTEWAREHNIQVKYVWFNETGEFVASSLSYDFAFSVDVRAAWRLVEKFLPYFRLEYYEGSHYTDKAGWHCDIWTDYGLSCVEGIETAALAISLAALDAALKDV